MLEHCTPGTSETVTRKRGGSTEEREGRETGNQVDSCRTEPRERVTEKTRNRQETSTIYTFIHSSINALPSIHIEGILYSN